MNKLANESSPYLLQHKNNPVEWFPWGEEAFKKAKEENKLVLVSVGYSACHWCHVMEHECFEDEEVAALMNEHFVNIKVDREERPDVDQVYMEAVQLITQRGGWPLNCFTLPNGQPFYGGTYFPKPGWMDVLNKLVSLYKNDPDKIKDYASNLTDRIQEGVHIYQSKPDQEFTTQLLDDMTNNWKKYFDRYRGGMQRAPKFPLPANYSFLLNQALLSGDEDLKDYVQFTLQKIARGGIYDHIGGGFARYSVDEFWKVPHFEKMLYDNGQLIELYSKAYSIYGDDEFKTVVEETISFCCNELLDPSHGFYCALDADSEGVEGKFYVWTKEELQTILGDNYNWFEELFSINEHGFWEGNYIPLKTGSDEEFAQKHGLTTEELKAKVYAAKQLLLTIRNERIRPGLDNKILLSWNALMISGLATAYKHFGNKEWLTQAEQTTQYLLRKHLSPEGTLYRTFRNGEPIEGFLDDYALFIKALMDLYSVNGNEQLMDQAKQLTDMAIDLFYEPQIKSFYYTSIRNTEVVVRQTEMYDNVIPASNSVMANNLLDLYYIYHNQFYHKIAVGQLQCVSQYLVPNGSNYSNWGVLMQKMVYPHREVVISGKGAMEAAEELSKDFRPNTLLLASTMNSGLPVFNGRQENEECTIFVCENQSCKLPVQQLEEARGLLA